MDSGTTDRMKFNINDLILTKKFYGVFYNNCEHDFGQVDSHYLKCKSCGMLQPLLAPNQKSDSDESLRRI